jgi:HAMP domain/His Kinase A (phospho-acceptor) domain
VKRIRLSRLTIRARLTLVYGGLFLLAGVLLQPLQRVTETARRIADAPAADRGLHERIALGGPHDELKQLADTFDAMLARLDGAFDGQRRFIANASHELRTPLALNRALLEVALHRTAAAPELRQLGETLLEVNTRHERLLGGLLLLARSDREVAERSYVDLADIVQHVVAQVPAGTVTVRAAPQEAPTGGDAVLLERLVQNLVDNGVRHNVTDGGWVQVTSDTGPDEWVVVQVSNTGPVIPNTRSRACSSPSAASAPSASPPRRPLRAWDFRSCGQWPGLTAVTSRPNRATAVAWSSRSPSRQHPDAVAMRPVVEQHPQRAGSPSTPWLWETSPAGGITEDVSPRGWRAKFPPATQASAAGSHYGDLDR